MLDDGTFELEGLVGEVDGSVITAQVTGRAEKARAVGSLWPGPLAEDGGAEILARVYAR